MKEENAIEPARQIEARFQLTASKQYEGGLGAMEFTFMPIFYEEGNPDHKFTEYTPSGEMTMQITNPHVIELLKKEKKFSVIFTPID